MRFYIAAIIVASVLFLSSVPVSASLIGPSQISAAIIGTGISGDLGSLTVADGVGVKVSSVDVGVSVVETIYPSSDVGSGWTVTGVGACRNPNGHFNCVDDPGFAESTPSGYDVSDYITTAGGTSDVLDEYGVNDSTHPSGFWLVSSVSLGYAWARNQSTGNPAWWARWSLMQTNGTPCVQFLSAPASSTPSAYWWPFGSCSWTDVNGTSFSVPWTINLVNSLTLRIEWLAPHSQTITIFATAISVHVHARVQEASVDVVWPTGTTVSALTWNCVEGGDTSVVWQIGSLSADGCDGVTHSSAYASTAILITGNIGGAASNAFNATLDVVAVGEPVPSVPAGSGLSMIVVVALIVCTAIYCAYRAGKWYYED